MSNPIPDEDVQHVIKRAVGAVISGFDEKPHWESNKQREAAIAQLTRTFERRLRDAPNF